MNPQPSPVFGQIVSLLFAALCVYLFLARPKNSSPSFCDRLDIGYYDDPSLQVQVVNNISQPPAKKNTLNIPFYNDCVETLVALGFKKRAATSLTKTILRDNDVTNIQDFLQIALRKS